MSFVVSLSSQLGSGTSEDFTTFLGSNIDCAEKDGWMVAVHSCTIYYSWYNISAEIGNNLIRYSKDSGDTFEADIVVPDGIYNLEDLNTYLQAVLFLRGDYLGTVATPEYQVKILPNYNTLRTEIVLLSTYQLDMTAGTLYQMLGLTSKIYTGSESGTGKVDVNRGIDRVNINVSICEGAIFAGSKSNSIYSFTPDKPPGSALVQTPVNMIYLPCTTNNFNSVRCTITDQIGTKIGLNGENSNVILHFKKFKV